MSSKKERVIVYIDGFNLYFGLLEAKFNHFKWLDLISLSKNLLKSSQNLIEVKYFTSEIANDPNKRKRQITYIEALESFGVKVYKGHYQKSTIKCNKCSNLWTTYNEKMTDVNIANQMLNDSYLDKLDAALLVSGDSDLVPPINTIHDSFSDKRVIVAFPPKRFNFSIQQVAKGSFTIGRRNFEKSQLPLTIQKQDGFILTKPIEWI